MALIFLSHSSRDKIAVRKMADRLGDAGFTVWLDEWRIRIGECIPTAISDGLGASRFLIVVLSPSSVGSGWVDREWKVAYWEEAQSRRLQILPVLLEQCEIPLLLRGRKFADLTADWDLGLKLLMFSLTDYLRDDAQKSFYAFTAVVAKEVAQGIAPDLRSQHWDAFEESVLSLPADLRLKVQRLNSLAYLEDWGLTVRQLRAELAALGFPNAVTSDDFDHDLARAIESFQRRYNLRHIDGVFGPLTYLQMKDIALGKKA